MRQQLLRFLLITVIMVSACGAQAASEPPFPSGPPQAESIRFQLAVYYPSSPKEEPLAALRAVAARETPALALTAALPHKPARMHLHARMEMDVKGNYAVPDLRALQYSGRGLSPAQSKALQHTKQALILNFAHPGKDTMQGLRNAYIVAIKVASRTGGLVWDEETREVFTPEKWQERRIGSWSGNLPDVAKHTVIHAYKSGELVRSITLGMSKFGQPDLIIDQFPWSSNDSMGNVLNLASQALVEGALIGPNGRLDLDINTLKNPAVRAREVASFKPNARGTASLALVKGKREEGDPRNRLAEITFSLHNAPDLHSRQDAVASSLYGSSDSVKYIRHDAELKAASERARKKLPALQADFARGLEPGEYIELKAPFATASGGREWMWVEVISWKGKQIEGALNNDPFDIPSMRAGQRVKVNQDDVFDYLRTFSNGTREGNSTGAIIEKMRGQVKQ